MHRLLKKNNLFLFSIAVLLSSCNLDFKQETNSYEIFVGEKKVLIEASQIKEEFYPIVSQRKNEFPTDSVYQISYESKDGQQWVIDIENRNIVLIAQIKNNILQGKYFTYHQNGKTRSIGFYKNGSKDGDWMQFYTSGIQINSGKFKDNEQLGEWYYYDTLKLNREKRNYISKYEYNFTSYDNLDRKKKSGAYLQGKPNGKWCEYDTFGRIEIELNYDKGKYHDSLIIFENGTMVAYQIYEYGKVIKEGLVEQEQIE